MGSEMQMFFNDLAGSTTFRVIAVVVVLIAVIAFVRGGR